jgi:predicted DNA-binding protein
MKSESLKIHMSDEMKEELEKTAEETGLGMSSIARRGIHDQLQELEG